MAPRQRPQKMMASVPGGALDRGLLVWVVEHRVGWLDPVFVGLSIAGYAGLVWVALAAAFARWTGRSAVVTTALTAATVWTTDLLTAALKAATDRPRPPAVVPEADPLLGGTLGDSMPSGHASTSFAGAVLLALLVGRAVPALLVLASLVAFSRVYVGVHYPLDVLAGAALGALVGVGVALLVRARFGMTLQASSRDERLKARRPTSEGPRQSEAAPPPG